MSVEADIREALLRAFALRGVEASPESITLEFPGIMSHGDLASSAALQYAKQANMAPRALAEQLVSELGAIEGVEKTEIAGPGFINFYVAPHVFADTVRRIVDAPQNWGKNDLHQGKRIMVEFTDPNPFKEFHIGHLMSNTIGEAIARSFEYAGAHVVRANYQGDVGPHVAKAIWALEKFGLDPTNIADLGKAYAEGATAYDNDEAAKQAIEAINAHLYDRSNPVINEVYAEGRKTSLDHFEELYRTLGTRFDRYFFESDTAPRGLAIVKAHPEVFAKSDGALVYKGEADGLHTRVFITSRGNPTYEAKDLGLLELKCEQGALDGSLTITAHEQADYFAVMLAAARRIPKLQDIARKTTHITHGMMRFAEGKMSSRTGNVVTGESLLASLTEKAAERAKESRAIDAQKLAEEIAVAAIKYQILKGATGKDIVFDEARALSLEGDSGPYLQYAHARAAQLMSRAKEEGVAPAYDRSAPPREVIRLAAQFPSVVRRATERLEPHLVVTYLIELSAAFNRWYAQEKILDGSSGAAHKVAVADAVRATLKSGLSLLGIPAPEKM